VGSDDDGSRGERLQLGQDRPMAQEFHHVESGEVMLKSLSDLSRKKTIVACSCSEHRHCPSVPMDVGQYANVHFETCEEDCALEASRTTIVCAYWQR